MKIQEIREQLQNYPKYPGTKKYPPASVCNAGFPSCFNVSMTEAEMHELWGGQYLGFDSDLIYSKIQPVIRHNDWQIILEDAEKRYRYLSVFDMADVGGLILQKSNAGHKEVVEFSINAMLSFIKSLGLGLEKLKVSYFAETNISEATNGKYKLNKNFPTDPMIAYWKKTGLNDSQFIADHSRDTMLALNIFGLPTPWGYRNEIFYKHQGKLLDIGTIEHLMYSPVFNEKKEIIDIKPLEHSAALTAVGVERISMLVNDIGNIWDVDIIKPLVKGAEKLFRLEEIEAMKITQALRAIHRIIADCKSYVNLGNKGRKGYFIKFFKVVLSHIDFNVENLKKIETLLALNSELQSFYPELGLSINQTLVELKQRKEAFDSDQLIKSRNY